MNVTRWKKFDQSLNSYESLVVRDVPVTDKNWSLLMTDDKVQ